MKQFFSVMIVLLTIGFIGTLIGQIIYAILSLIIHLFK